MSALPFSRHDAARVQSLLRQHRPCLLCGGAPHVAGLFVPDTPELWGGTPGKRRLLGYTLCRACYALPDRAMHVESKIMAGLVGPRN